MKSKNVAYLLWFFLGYWGIHRFYCRKWVSGIIWLFTFGLFGVGWLVDAVLTSKMVDEANGLASAQVSANLRKEFRGYAITAAVVVGLTAIAGIVSIVSDELDKRTPEQKTQDARETLLKEYNELRRDFPSMKVDGKIVPIDLSWAGESVAVILPKTYGFGATRFAQRAVQISRDDFRSRAEDYGGHYFVGVGVKIYSGPSESWSSYRVAIPKTVVPTNFVVK
jgi:TM2 domain-containing membrane protein YozV